MRSKLLSPFAGNEMNPAFIEKIEGYYTQNNNKKQLISETYDLSAVDGEGRNLLMHLLIKINDNENSKYYGNYKLVLFLKDLVANHKVALDKVDFFDNNIFHFLSTVALTRTEQNWNILNFLLQYLGIYRCPNLLTDKNLEGLTPIQKAIEAKNVFVFSQLLNVCKEDQIYTKDEVDYSLADMIDSFGTPEIKAVFTTHSTANSFETKQLSSTNSSRKQSPLFNDRGVFTGSLETLKVRSPYFLQTLENRDNRNLLMCAILDCNKGLFDYLLDNKIQFDLTAKDIYGRNVLDMSASSNDSLYYLNKLLGSPREIGQEELNSLFIKNNKKKESPLKSLMLRKETIPDHVANLLKSLDLNVLNDDEKSDLAFCMFSEANNLFLLNFENIGKVLRERIPFNNTDYIKNLILKAIENDKIENLNDFDLKAVINNNKKELFLKAKDRMKSTQFLLSQVDEFSQSDFLAICDKISNGNFIFLLSKNIHFLYNEDIKNKLYSRADLDLGLINFRSLLDKFEKQKSADHALLADKLLILEQLLKAIMDNYKGEVEKLISANKLNLKDEYIGYFNIVTYAIFFRKEIAAILINKIGKDNLSFFQKILLFFIKLPIVNQAVDNSYRSQVFNKNFDSLTNAIHQEKALDNENRVIDNLTPTV